MNYKSFSYIITGFPRCGSAWVSTFLSLHPDGICYHEPELPHTYDESEKDHSAIIGAATFVPTTVDETVELPSKIIFLERDMEQSSKIFYAWASRYFPINKFVIEDMQRRCNLFKQARSPKIIQFSELFNPHMYELKKLWRMVYDSDPFPLNKAKQLLRMQIQLNNSH